MLSNLTPEAYDSLELKIYVWLTSFVGSIFPLSINWVISSAMLVKAYSTFSAVFAEVSMKANPFISANCCPSAVETSLLKITKLFLSELLVL